LHEDQRGHAACVGAMLLLDRRHRIDPALRSLRGGGSRLEPVPGARSVRRHVPLARAGKSRDQWSQARSGRSRGPLLL